MLYKVSEWESNGRWYVANVQKLGDFTIGWWVPADIFGISLTDYVNLLIEKYHATIELYKNYPQEDKRNSLLIFHFDKYIDAHKLILDINRVARQKKYFI